MTACTRLIPALITWCFSALLAPAVMHGQDPYGGSSSDQTYQNPSSYGYTSQNGGGDQQGTAPTPAISESPTGSDATGQPATPGSGTTEGPAAPAPNMYGDPGDPPPDLELDGFTFQYVTLRIPPDKAMVTVRSSSGSLDATEWWTYSDRAWIRDLIQGSILTRTVSAEGQDTTFWTISGTRLTSYDLQWRQHEQHTAQTDASWVESPTGPEGAWLRTGTYVVRWIFGDGNPDENGNFQQEWNTDTYTYRDSVDWISKRNERQQGIGGPPPRTPSWNESVTVTERTLAPDGAVQSQHAHTNSVTTSVQDDFKLSSLMIIDRDEQFIPVRRSSDVISEMTQTFIGGRPGMDKASTTRITNQGEPRTVQRTTGFHANGAPRSFEFLGTGMDQFMLSWDEAGAADGYDLGPGWVQGPVPADLIERAKGMYRWKLQADPAYDTTGSPSDRAYPFFPEIEAPQPIQPPPPGIG